MTRQAIFPGSFDPFTVGHESIVRRALAMFDEITIAIGYNSNKQTMFSLENRKKLVADIFSDEPRIKIANYSGLTVDFAKSIGVGFILRGLRTSADFEFERAIAQINKQMTGIDTVCPNIHLLIPPLYAILYVMAAMCRSLCPKELHSLNISENGSNGASGVQPKIEIYILHITLFD